MHDDARPRPVGLDADRAREHRSGGEALAQHGDVVEPVEQRQHDARLDRDALQGARQPAGLRGDEQRVDRLLQSRERARARHEVAERHALDAQALARDHRCGALARDHDDLAAVPLEHAREQAADSSGPEDGDPHALGSISTPGFMIPAGSTASFAPRSAAANGSGR